ncbi:hypothetical protein Ga0100230_004305 [Opitutaceae bacterium TAV3]|nr:hypothetical protein Ga0100230_004305 [Opitutaceae bacterium TAV3]
MNNPKKGKAGSDLVNKYLHGGNEVAQKGAEVLTVVEDESKAGRARGRDGGGQEAGGAPGGEIRGRAVEREDLGDMLDRMGLRERAATELTSMLGAVVYLWDAKAQTHHERPDFQTRMKAIEQIFNRTDGMPRRYLEVLQAIAMAKSKEGDREAGSFDLTPQAAAALERMLAEWRRKRGGSG